MNAQRVNVAAGVIARAMKNGTQTAAGLAIALDSAQLLQSPETAAELEQLRARVAELEAERHSMNEALSDAAESLRANRDRIADLEALTPAAVQTCRVCGAGYTYGQPCSTCEFNARMAAEADGITRRIAPTQTLREPVEGEHYALVHHDYLVSRDLPETGGAR